MRYYIKDNHYFDIDHYNQLRITGAENHLLFGATFPKDVDIEVVKYKIVAGRLVVDIKLSVNEINFALPLVCDIRTLRKFTEGITPRPTYEELVMKGNVEVIPKQINHLKKKNNLTLQFINEYQDTGIRKHYGCEIILPKKTQLHFDNPNIIIKSKENIEFKLRTISNIKIERKKVRKIFKQDITLPTNILSPFLINLYDQEKENITHLIRAKKTSSFEYGTIFPRDWIESADLGFEDFTQETIDYMYDQSMNFVSDEGEAWHENLVGEFKVKTSNEQEHIDRRMIDIEPKYIMGFERLSMKFLFKNLYHEKMIMISKYIINNALNKDFITFKKVPNHENEYHFIGNWRDSYFAFPRQKSPLAPYDVNCVFYPLSLKIIRKYGDYFKLEDKELINELIEKWDNQKSKFRLYHPDNIIGYSLALHSKKNIPLPTAHLDESYDLFYSSPSMEEIVSFARKIIDPEYFYTPVGPILVATDDDEFTTGHYHGKVIWPKQAAYSIAGLTRQYKRGIRENWPSTIIQIIRNAIIKTAEACFKGWEDLGVVPELYYYDENEEKAKFYTDQDDYEGQMSLMQLWSSVGTRKIIRDYIEIISS